MIELSDDQAQMILNALTGTPIGQAISILVNSERKEENDGPSDQGTSGGARTKQREAEEAALGDGATVRATEGSTRIPRSA